VQTTQTATGLSIGAYTVTITDLFGCTATENVVISAGNCSAQFNIIPDTLPQHYLAINMANGAAPLTYSWNWGDGTPNDFTPFPSHTYATAGYYTICLSIADANGCTNTYCNSLYLQKTSGVIYVSVVPPVPTGISEFISSLSYSIYPNPAADFITIVSPTKVVQSPFTIYNITGEQVLSTILTSQKSAIDISVISNGIYITELQNGTSNPRQKLLIEH
jgi:PKD repeat protein